MKKNTILGFCIALVVLAGAVGFRFFAPYHPTYGKGGIGALGKENHVVTFGEDNVVLCGETTWVGLKRTEPEDVVCQKGAVKPLSWASLTPQSTVIMFSENRIQIFDLEDLSGGYYRRQ